jgi:hypothetical protein
MEDVIDPSRGGVVPMNVRTDGAWIWTDATTYYLERYNLMPDPGLLRHIRAAGYRMPEVDRVAIHRATAVLQEPPENAPRWTYPPDRVTQPTIHCASAATAQDPKVMGW